MIDVTPKQNGNCFKMAIYACIVYFSRKGNLRKMRKGGLITCFSIFVSHVCLLNFFLQGVCSRIIRQNLKSEIVISACAGKDARNVWIVSFNSYNYAISIVLMIVHRRAIKISVVYIKFSAQEEIVSTLTFQLLFSMSNLLKLIQLYLFN